MPVCECECIFVCTCGVGPMSAYASHGYTKSFRVRWSLGTICVNQYYALLLSTMHAGVCSPPPPPCYLECHLSVVVRRMHVLKQAKNILDYQIA